MLSSYAGLLLPFMFVVEDHPNISKHISRRVAWRETNAKARMK